MLDGESGEKGLNFLTPEIFEVARRRIRDPHGTVDAYRLLHNMLSSQPMCFNLFGPLVADQDLARCVLESVLPVGVKLVTRVEIEYAPEPANEYLDDRTAFDAFAEFVMQDGSRGFVGIETKLTEPFSGKQYDRPAYRRWTERHDSPWPRESWGSLAEVRHNQLWRDHLLAVAMVLHPRSLYDRGFLTLVRHPADKECAETAAGYAKLLKEDDRSFLDCPLDELVDAIESVARGSPHEHWAADFRQRYLDLSLSEEEWRRRAGG